MLRVTLLIAFAVSSYCQGPRFSHIRDHAININMPNELDSFEEFKEEEWIAESEDKGRGVTDTSGKPLRPDNGERYVQTWKPQMHHYNKDLLYPMAEDNSDPVAHVAAPVEMMLWPVTPLPEELPYTAIGRFSKALCTGTFVARKAILTAAHCVYERGEFVNLGKFQKQKDCNNKGVKEYIPVTTLVPEDYAKDEKRTDLDYAIIITNEESTDWLRYDDSSYAKMDLVGYGYLDGDPNQCMWESTCQLVKNEKKSCITPCYLKPSMSGGPVYDPINKVIVGIHSAGDNGKPPIEENDTGVRITGTVKATITDWINKYGGN